MSHYKVCPECGIDVTIADKKMKPTRDCNNAEALGIPFKCGVCGGLHIGFTPTLDRVMVWPDPLPKTYSEDGQIEIPEPYRNDKLSDLGHVLAFGKGYYDSKRFHPIADLYVGARVIYDRTVPWDLEAKGSDGNKHRVKMMGFLDIKVVLEK